ncbi:MAG: hypothetical protein OEZ48_17505 [Candidatus Bathyarchaeota archaeon]|nr:hypothetical protein [Candidatus Bathyarchaeota archaeon]
MIKERDYWIYLIAIFGSFALVIWLCLVPYNFLEYNLAVNLFTSSIFMVLTVVFLSWLAELREQREWMNVERWVMRKLAKHLYHLVNILARFIYPEIFRTRPSKQEFLKILESLNSMNEATLKEHAYYYFPMPSDRFAQSQIDILSKYGKYLSDIETKYARFLRPELYVSLVKIQDYLESIFEDFDLAREFEDAQEVAERSLSKSILEMMKEIYKVHKMGIEIYYPEIPA